MDIIREEIRYRSFNSDDTIVAFIYAPADNTKIRGVVQIVHGMAEHVKRYSDFANFLCNQGFVVCGNDHVGHGQSVDHNGDYGYFGEKQSGVDTLIEDVRYLQTITAKKYRKVSYFIFGHSMGSFVSRIYTSKYGDDIDGLILCGTGGNVGPMNIATKLGMTAVKANIKKNGMKHKSSTIDNLAFGSYNKKIKDKKSKFDWLSRDENQVNKYLDDKECGFLFTNNGFLNLFKLIEVANSNETYKDTKTDLPILLISGDMDPVGNYGKGVVSVYNKYLDSGIQDIKIHLYEGARHELLNETNREEVKNDILSWLNSHIL